MALRWTFDATHCVDRVVITDEWPSARVRRRVCDALDRAGPVRRHMPVLIDLRELTVDVLPAYGELLETFWRVLGVDEGVRRAILTSSHTAANTMRVGSGTVGVFTDEEAAVRWLRTSEVWDRR